MSAPGTVLVWICAALTALPLAPCAFLASGCRAHEQQARAEAEPEPARSCCAQNDEPVRGNSQPEQSPCKGECCEISPFVPSGENLVAPPQVMLFVAFAIVDDSRSIGVDAPQAIAVPQGPSLNVLHCQWRC